MASFEDLYNIHYEHLEESLYRFFAYFPRPDILRPHTSKNPYHIYLHKDDLEELQRYEISQLGGSIELRYIARTYRRVLTEYMEFMSHLKKYFMGTISPADAFATWKLKGLSLDKRIIIRSSGMRHTVELYENQLSSKRFLIYGWSMLRYLDEHDIYQPYKRNSRLLEAVRKHVIQNPFPEETSLYEQLEVIVEDLSDGNLEDCGPCTLHRLDKIQILELLNSLAGGTKIDLECDRSIMVIEKFLRGASEPVYNM
ncbi:hypothetical protein COCC4DRAFT_148872 [Bipolaris maydis ATCC 48331]|uniref:Uncharacterized protein n=2 Tax=Cochliobolus heterostrophus TaxID=5016 RepID=M2US47_COCH5|nr:uncharacterized protein COCC4DRAFT_148872 [Bipolaris maydis ATCC 48331]EMD96386.1 hypothetical protein COCHEDRAFT_1208327 [Bipolaris maydis C5]KAJ5031704.1 hypothetical protein J3E73DRAFT_178879 [Bipolaris maydis]ENI01088.1 hypothetical protein COCC4DRAFT_148872 [Bipolaris maydis ATCC 48331]KAJ6211044.1 hypothetical protein PSV09DRAFT_1208327 [Bipolaris maydis]KAJ6273438.1 hypothetical protein PSV08DRAFT_174690 [Bipolaris maydis]